jgi:TRAP-type C4-dicarboxylate transport system substrate-binding protein
MPANKLKDFNMKPTLVRWVLAHEPIELFILAAERFVKLVEERAPGRLNVGVLTLSEYAEKYNDGKKVSKTELIDFMTQGRFEMCQAYTYRLSKFNKDLDALDLPFLFDSHEKAARVFEGPLGQQLIDGYEATNPKLKGLAYTYSGGFKNILFTNEVNSLEDFRGAKIRVSDSPVSEATWKAMGVTPARVEIEDLREHMGAGTVDGGECTWSRFYGSNCNDVTHTIYDTQHNLLLTNIIANADFFKSLDPELQEIVRQAAVEAGRYEREISIDDAPATERQARKDGFKVIKLSAAERQQFIEATKQIYQQFENWFTPGLVQQLRQA